VTGLLNLSTSMTLNDLEPSQKGFLVNFLQYLDAAHISILNYDEMAGVRPRQPAYEIFSIKRRFQQSKSRSPRFMEPGAGGCQRRLPLLKSGYLPQLSSVAWKRLHIHTDMLLLLIFAIFCCSTKFKNELRRKGWRQTDSLRRETAIGFRTSREH